MQERLESLKGQLRRMRDQASLSTLTVSLRVPPTTPDVLPPQFWSPFRTASQAAQALGRWARGAVDGVIWLMVLGAPFAAIAGVIVWAAWGLARRYGLGASLAAAAERPREA